jgi:predicted dinucleotide-binding enzyme
MHVAIIGAGNVGSALSKAAVTDGRTVSQDWSWQSGWALLGPTG